MKRAKNESLKYSRNIHLIPYNSKYKIPPDNYFAFYTKSSDKSLI